MVRAWRIVKGRYAAIAFNGEGARRFGGRWNSPGVPMVYTSDSMPLAILETIVNLEKEEFLHEFRALQAEFDDSLVEELPISTLPARWNATEPSRALARLGDKWIATGRSAVLRVPSAVSRACCNYLFNPQHRDFARVRVGPPEPFEFDPRLIRRLVP